MSRHLVHEDHTPLRASAPEARGAARASRATMAGLVQDLLDSLPAGQGRQALRPFDDAERFNWHYIPRPRAGLPINAMGEATRAALDALLRSALSEAGYQKATGIMRLEKALGLIENRPHYRDPENYSVTVFGRPGRGPFGWRIEGHHLSLNFTASNEEILAVTPSFWGSNPAQVPAGCPGAGHRVLGRETELAYQLIRGLDAEGRARAIIAQSSLGNIITGPGRESLVHEHEGVALAAMPDGLRELALELLSIYARNLRKECADAELARIREAEVGKIHFAWGGPLESGHAHYWRLHGPITLLEYDCTQNDANHIHSVWHDLARNFGRDPLREHYDHGHRHHA
ncbi:MAG: DUF3500 domain-containing protein [Geminicoccaceae bacterium]